MQIDVHENWLGANSCDDVGARGKAHGGHDHFVALAHPADLESHFQACCRRSHHAYMAILSEIRRQRRLEGLYLRTARQLPRAKYLGDCSDGVRVDGGSREG